MTLAAVVVAHAALMLGPGGYARAPVLGGDGSHYLALAANLLDHGRFSAAAVPPFEPTVFRAPAIPRSSP